MEVFPDTDTTYTITATGAGGSSTRSATITVGSPISVRIISPADGESINRPDVLVHGTFANATGGGTGITVNGEVAMVYGDRFVVNHLSLQEGSNTIAVTATDVDGNVSETAITVFSQGTENHISLSADAESGVDTLETILRVNGPLIGPTPSITVTGPDAVTFLESFGENEYPVIMGQPGIYHFTAEISDAQGETYRDSVAIAVLSTEELDILLKARWADMKTALLSGDIERALQFHQQRSHERYSAIYNALGNDLPALVQQMQGLSWVCYRDGTAKFRIRQDHDINGQITTITYYIYFSRGENGLWLIEKY